MFRFLLLLSDRMRQRAFAKRYAGSTLATGRLGEDLAHRFLQKEGYRVIARNWRTRSGRGEVDIIAVDPGGVLVFVEVKCRQSDEYGDPLRSIGRDKERQLVRAAAEYLQRMRGRWQEARVDTVTVVLGTPPQIEHSRDVFRLVRRRPPASAIY